MKSHAILTPRYHTLFLCEFNTPDEFEDHARERVHNYNGDEQRNVEYLFYSNRRKSNHHLKIVVIETSLALVQDVPPGNSHCLALNSFHPFDMSLKYQCTLIPDLSFAPSDAYLYRNILRSKHIDHSVPSNRLEL